MAFIACCRLMCLAHLLSRFDISHFLFPVQSRSELRKCRNVLDLNVHCVARLRVEHSRNRFPKFSPSLLGEITTCSRLSSGRKGSGRPLKSCFSWRFVVLPLRIELRTSPLPRECSTTELRQRRPYFIGVSSLLTLSPNAVYIRVVAKRKPGGARRFMHRPSWLVRVHGRVRRPTPALEGKANLPQI
jgi:hypothetical protein